MHAGTSTAASSSTTVSRPGSRVSTRPATPPPGSSAIGGSVTTVAKVRIVAGGTGPGEEKMLLDIWPALKQAHPRAKLAIVPFHVWMPWVHAEHPTCTAGLLAVYANLALYIMVRVLVVLEDQTDVSALDRRTTSLELFHRQTGGHAIVSCSLNGLDLRSQGLNDLLDTQCLRQHF